MWYIMSNGQQVGPMPKEDLVKHNLTADSMVWKEGMADWAKASEVAELQPLVGGYKAAPAAAPAAAEPQKTKTVFGILAILLGAYGIQYFYIGKKKGGIISLCITFISCFFLSFIPGLVGLIQGIKVLMGTQEEFEEKYLNTDKDMPLFE